MSEPDADLKAEKPQRRPGAGGGTAKGRSRAHQADTACDEHAQNQILVTMERVLCREKMLRAYQRVVSNQGAAGVDGVTVGQLQPLLLQARWEAVRKELFAGTYQPSPVRKVEIPKPGGGTRTLGIPTVLDLLIQQALYQALQGWYDPTFSDHSFGFRLGRGTHDAIERAREHVAAGHRWVVDMDLEKFFDRVNHDILMSRLARRITDKRILRLIRRYLHAGTMAEELDGWIRRKLRAILWRQWKRPWTRAREMIRRGLDRQRSWTSTTNGRGPWWNAGASHMHHAVPTRALTNMGLCSLAQESERLSRST